MHLRNKKIGTITKNLIKFPSMPYMSLFACAVGWIDPIDERIEHKSHKYICIDYDKQREKNPNLLRKVTAY